MRLSFAFAATLCCAVASAQTASQLCIARQDRPIDPVADCMSTQSDTVTVAAENLPRRYVWRTDKSETLGVIDARQTTVSRTSHSGEVTFDIRIPAGRRVSEAAVRIISSANDDGWRWSWRGAEVVRRHLLRLPIGRFKLEIAGEGFRTARQIVEITAKPLRLPNVNLEPLPAVSGSVVLPDGAPAAGATIAAGNRIQLADISGHFVIAVENDWPESITIESAGLARKTVHVPTVRVDVDLGTIKLVRGGSIIATVEGGRADRELRCELLRAGKVIRAMVKKPEVIRVAFEGVEPGSYQLRLRGGEPLQALVKRINVEEGRVSEVSITIVPHTLTVTTYLGSEKLPDATVWFRSTDHQWESSVKTDDGARAVAELWQPGKYLISAETQTLERRYAEFVTIDDIAEPDLILRLPNRTVTGIVLEEGGSPVTHAQIALETTRPGPENIASTFRAETDDAGRFVYHTVAAGHQKLTARAEGFLSSEAKEFDLQESEAGREVTIHLRRGIERKIVVLDVDEIPIGEAVVAETVHGRFLGFRTTDFTGKLSIQVPAGEERTLFLIPRRGSFAVATLRPVKETEPAPLRIVVPLPRAALEITTQTRSGKPAPNVWFLLRYNGQMIPLEVLQLFDRVQGLKFFTGASGLCRLTNVPIGTYELWPVLGAKEAQEILMNRAGKPPVRVEVAPGENFAILTFSPAE